MNILLFALRANSSEKRSPFAAAKAAACFLLLTVLLSLQYGCEQNPAAAPSPHAPPKVTVSTPVHRNIVDYLELTGNTQAINTVQLRARVEGYLEGVFFKDGDIVKKDQLLFLIQQNTFLARFQQAEAAVQTQKAQLDHARTEFARFSKLYQQKAAAETDVENWRFQRDSAQAALAAAEAQRDLAKLDLGYTWVTAPFTGRIDRRLVDPGNLVGSGGSTVLAEITQINPLYVYFTASETDIPPEIKSARWITAGSSERETSKRNPIYVQFAKEEGYPHEGSLDFASTTVNSTTGTVLLRGVLPNPDGTILPGQFARVRLPVSGQRPAILVPQTAVGFDQQGAFVLVVNGGNTVERRNIKTGVQRKDMYVVSEGLTGNEMVIVKGLIKTAPGMQVAPEPAPVQPDSATAAYKHNDLEG